MNAFLALGAALILGALFGKIMNKIKMPAVAGYIIAGLVIGVSGFRILNGVSLDALSFLSDFALCIIAFNIGSELEVDILKKMGRSIPLGAVLPLLLECVFACQPFIPVPFLFPDSQRGISSSGESMRCVASLNSSSNPYPYVAPILSMPNDLAPFISYMRSIPNVSYQNLNTPITRKSLQGVP